MIEMLSYSFMQRALVAGMIAGFLCSYVAFFVVLKKLSFFGVGISHSAFGGIALGLLLKINPILSGGIFSTLVAWGIGFTSKKEKLQEDISIGILFSSTMAFGIIIAGFTQGYYTDLFSFFFGNILAVKNFDLIALSIAGILIVGLLTAFFKELLFICFDEEAARSDGLPVVFLYYLLLTCMAITVIVVVKVVGIILASALMVIPAATGYRLSSNYRLMLLISLASGVLASTGGLILSYYFNLASGATIVLLSTLIFFFSAAFSHYQQKKKYVNSITIQQSDVSHQLSEKRAI